MEVRSKLASEVRERRRSLGLTRIQIRDRGGPSEPTLTKVERGESPDPSPATLAKLDAGLGWTPGSAASTVMGGKPTLAGGGDGSTVLLTGDHQITVEPSVVASLVAVVSELAGVAEQQPDNEPLQTVAANLSAALHPLYGRYVTRLFELNRREYGTLSPILAVFAHLLDEPDGSADPDEYDERQYRRWLAGRTAGLDDESQMRFSARLGTGD